MQVEGDWRTTANVHLLLGLEHPPARLEKALLTPAQRGIAGASATGGPVTVDARNTANFRSSAYCGLQDKSAPSVRRHIVAYYREMLRRIPLWRGLLKTQLDASDRNTVVKTEPHEEEEDDNGGVAAAPAGGTLQTSGAGAPVFRAVGILTQVQDTAAVTEAAQQAPWEFYMVRDLEDDECYVRALQAMAHHDNARERPFILLQDAPRAGVATRGSGEREGVIAAHGLAGAAGAAGEETAETAAEADEEAAARDGTRLSLYTRVVPQFTGLHPGMAVGVIGEPFQRSARGVITGVLVREFVLPSRPTLPWRIDRPLPVSPAKDAVGVRIHFCSGPLPRRDVAGLLRTVATQALHRGADVLIIGGPFIPPFSSDFERGLLPSLGATFNEVMESFVDTLEETLKQYYATRPLLPHMKVLLVSHKGDVTQIPVLPTTMYAIADTDDILIRSNPCRLSVNGVHVSVCNEDVVGDMRERMVERWPTAEGSLRRVVEAVVTGRLYTPLYGFPVATADLKHLPQLRLDYVPPQNELLDMEAENLQSRVSTTSTGSGGGVKAERRDDGDGDGGGAFVDVAHAGASRGWEAVFHVAQSTASTSAAAAAKAEVKRVKREPEEPDRAVEAAATTTTTVTTAAAARAAPSSCTEFLPHILFLPSTRPQFATVTHQCEDVDGADVDDTASATGVLVVNQEVWSTRSSPKFQLRVAEVTIADTERVLRRGASAANGVACGVLHIYSA
ncbi:DNA polymerase alpha/epsilon subunit B [Novymonas esmeraldas]|uniref:DNA polymerase alpha subunit B n=1 Tax=Novymonas esmeraldas TaxID=1808958 RepID=A0AAW0F127_9TRYP